MNRSDPAASAGTPSQTAPARPGKTAASDCLALQTTGAAPFKKRAPTLYFIIVIKLGKALLLFLLAAGVYSLTDNNLPEEFRDLLLSLHLDPEKKFFSDLAAKISQITPSNLILFASGTVFYAMFSLVEGVGLIFRVGWAGWMAVGESIFFIPIELYELNRHFTWSVLVILGLNIMIVWYLLQNRRRLFRHAAA